jgi:hypothetical protein
MFFTLTVEMVIVSLNQLDMTQEELEFLSKITERYLASCENLTVARYHAHKKGIELGNRINVNPLDVIPLEELNNPDVPLTILRERYNVHRRWIERYRKENNIVCKKRRLRGTFPISVIPLDELNNPHISSAELFKKYRVSKGTVQAYRNAHNIKYTRPSGYTMPRRKK